MGNQKAKLQVEPQPSFMLTMDISDSLLAFFEKNPRGEMEDMIRTTCMEFIDKVDGSESQLRQLVVNMFVTVAEIQLKMGLPKSYDKLTLRQLMKVCPFYYRFQEGLLLSEVYMNSVKSVSGTSSDVTITLDQQEFCGRRLLLGDEKNIDKLLDNISSPNMVEHDTGPSHQPGNSRNMDIGALMSDCPYFYDLHKALSYSEEFRGVTQSTEKRLRRVVLDTGNGEGTSKDDGTSK